MNTTSLAQNSLHAMTVDVEDYFHVAALADTVKRKDWGSMESRVRASNDRLLALFDDAGIKATFFVLGWVAEQDPAIVRSIVAAGHEVACHGYSHQLIYKQSEALFREETSKAKQILEDQAQLPVQGYRAASYSITRASLWALDVLIDHGFVYDSSIFPVRHDNYGIPDAPRVPHRIERHGGSLVELPLPAVTLPGAGLNLPATGGGYFRLYPYALSRQMVRWFTGQTQGPFIFYLHPWEIDPDQPRFREASLLSRFRHYQNLHRTEPRLRQLLKDFKFGTMAQVLAACEPVPAPSLSST